MLNFFAIFAIIHHAVTWDADTSNDTCCADRSGTDADLEESAPALIRSFVASDVPTFPAMMSIANFDFTLFTISITPLE